MIEAVFLKILIYSIWIESKVNKKISRNNLNAGLNQSIRHCNSFFGCEWSLLAVSHLDDMEGLQNYFQVSGEGMIEGIFPVYPDFVGPYHRVIIDQRIFLP